MGTTDISILAIESSCDERTTEERRVELRDLRNRRQARDFGRVEVRRGRDIDLAAVVEAHRIVRDDVDTAGVGIHTVDEEATATDTDKALRGQESTNVSRREVL